MECLHTADRLHGVSPWTVLEWREGCGVERRLPPWRHSMEAVCSVMSPWRQPPSCCFTREFQVGAAKRVAVCCSVLQNVVSPFTPPPLRI